MKKPAVQFPAELISSSQKANGRLQYFTAGAAHNKAFFYANNLNNEAWSLNCGNKIGFASLECKSCADNIRLWVQRGIIKISLSAAKWVFGNLEIEIGGKRFSFAGDFGKGSLINYADLWKVSLW